MSKINYFEYPNYFKDILIELLPRLPPPISISYSPETENSCEMVEGLWVVNGIRTHLTLIQGKLMIGFKSFNPYDYENIVKALT